MFLVHVCILIRLTVTHRLDLQENILQLIHAETAKVQARTGETQGQCPVQFVDFLNTGDSINLLIVILVHGTIYFKPFKLLISLFTFFLFLFLHCILILNTLNLWQNKYEIMQPTKMYEITQDMFYIFNYSKQSSFASMTHSCHSLSHPQVVVTWNLTSSS